MSDTVKFERLLVAILASCVASPLALQIPKNSLQTNLLTFGSSVLAGEGESSQKATRPQPIPSVKTNKVVETRSHPHNIDRSDLNKVVETRSNSRSVRHNTQQVVRTRSSPFSKSSGINARSKIPSDWKNHYEQEIAFPLKPQTTNLPKTKLEPFEAPQLKTPPAPSQPKLQHSLDFKEKPTTGEVWPLQNQELASPTSIDAADFAGETTVRNPVAEGLMKGLQILAISFWGIPLWILLSKIEKGRRNKLSS